MGRLSTTECTYLPTYLLDFDSMHALSLRISGNFNFEHIFDIWPIWCELAVFWHVMSSNSWGISPSPFDSKSNQGYVRVGHGPECHSRP